MTTIRVDDDDRGLRRIRRECRAGAVDVSVFGVRAADEPGNVSEHRRANRAELPGGCFIEPVAVGRLSDICGGVEWTAVHRFRLASCGIARVSRAASNGREYCHGRA